MYSNKIYLSFILLVALVAWGGASCRAYAGDPFQNDLPPNLKKIGDLKPTFYWVALETVDGQPKNNALLDINEKVLAMISDKFLKGISMEGTGKLLDGRVINFHVRVNKQIRWRECPPSAPYGYGLEDYVLKPFHSVAVDPNVIPIPSRVFIPAAQGAVLPDGSIHDGYFEAVDIGEAIQNQRIDVFTAMGDQSSVFERHGFSNMKATPVYLVVE
jgi:3D (Asp-Asp-Asp) domain-containing protein